MLIIAGEWIETGIHKNVGTSVLSRRWVICSAWLERVVWLPDQDYTEIYDEEVDIYHVSRGGIFRETPDTRRINASMEKLQDITNAVDRECPFAKSFGIVGGVGEGIVWKPDDANLNSNPIFWLKMKGPHFSEQPKKRGASPSKLEEKDRAKSLAEKLVTERRLEQGVEYLNETGKEANLGSIARSLAWIIDDIQAEEQDIVEEAGLEVDGGALRPAIYNMARKWLIEYTNRQQRGELDSVEL